MNSSHAFMLSLVDAAAAWSPRPAFPRRSFFQRAFLQPGPLLARYDRRLDRLAHEPRQGSVSTQAQADAPLTGDVHRGQGSNLTIESSGTFATLLSARLQYDSTCCRRAFGRGPVATPLENRANLTNRAAPHFVCWLQNRRRTHAK